MTVTSRILVFLVYCCVVTLANVGVLQRLFEFSRADSSASHLILIPFVTLWLVYDGRARIFSDVRTEWTLGLVLVGMGAALRFGWGVEPASGATVYWLISATAALAILWIAGFVLFFGRAASRAAMFPLAFLVFMIPIPPVVLNAVVSFLKTGSTYAVDALFALTATTYHREGFVFTLPSVTIEIADECSGIRSSIALMLTSLLAGHLYLRAGWSKALLVAAVLPVAVLKNGIRITALSLLSIHVNPSFLEGRLHTDGGIVFFLISLGILAPVLIALRRAERQPPGPAVLA
jgi:exosortase